MTRTTFSEEMPAPLALRLRPAAARGGDAQVDLLMAKRTNRVVWGMVMVTAPVLSLMLMASLWYAGVWLANPHPKLSTREDFQQRLKQRQEIIALARAEKLPAAPHNFHLKRLPNRYSYLSDGGEIIVEKPKGNTKVFFFTYRGLLTGGCNGFIYARDDQPTMYEFPRLVRVERLAPHWFWVISDD
jgi:hypothetical protein